MAYKKPESVLVLIEDQQGMILVMQRDDDASFWQSVTGTLEDNELPIQTAYREVLEETGIDLKRLNCVLQDENTVNEYTIRKDWRHRYAPGTLTNREYVFSVVVPCKLPIRLTEHTAYEWLDASSAISRVWSLSNKEAIKKFAKVDEQGRIQAHFNHSDTGSVDS